MKTFLREFIRDETQPLEPQLTRFVRGLIQSGRLQSGQQLPSTQEMAQAWGTQASRAHAALEPLVKDQLLYRIRGRGTFVHNMPRRFESVGIYLLEDIWQEQHGAITRALCRGLIASAEERGVKARFFIDHRPPMQQGEPYAELMSAVRDGSIQAVVVPRTDTLHDAWLPHLPVPVAMHFNSPTIKSPRNMRVASDYVQMMDKSFVELARQGCRLIGLIIVAKLQWFFPDADECGDMVAHAVTQARSFGLELRPEWVIQPEDVALPEAGALEFGRTAMRRMWSLADRPEGVMVFSDVAARGVLEVVEELNIPIPGALKLVLHRNQGVPLECRHPVAFAQTSPAAVAQAMIEQVAAQYRGEAVFPRRVDISIVKAPSGIAARPLQMVMREVSI